MGVSRWMDLVLMGGHQVQRLRETERFLTSVVTRRGTEDPGFGTTVER